MLICLPGLLPQHAQAILHAALIIETLNGAGRTVHQDMVTMFVATTVGFFDDQVGFQVSGDIAVLA